MIILCSFLIASVLSKGPCDLKLECQDKVFEDDARALCLGFRGCIGAEFATSSNPVCSGALGCQDATITKIPEKILCNGFESCRGMKKGLKATYKAACNGLKACQGIIGKLEAPIVACDGDIACVDKKIVADGGSALATPVENLATCNGKKACVSSNVISKLGRIDCDGDTACKKAGLSASTVACGGKRGCYESIIKQPTTVFAYGFNSIANAQIIGGDGDEEIRALGMNAVMGSTVTTGQSGTTTILGYGFKSLVGAAIKCVGTTTCKITCKMNACKLADIFVAANANLEIDPIECDPRDANYVGPSKKDPTMPARAKGVNCPTISGPGVKASDADLSIEEWEKAHFDAFKQSNDYKEMIELAEISENSLDAIIAEEVSAWEDNLDLEDKDQESELMVVGQTVSSSSGNHMIASNLLTGLAVFIMTLVGSLCYIAYKFGGNNGETKALLQ
eukprot:CAMPEP_0201574348 /NCGR_PEP_ID=MMETSP0190_2-20130828/18786_1 /ASSEMBLY_ACC=CAM_ASM_000263 /TAXON_ID=37353 /ORGANISM="Rosalina sp." /LENGTH=450 /DNA_ID=CAMNT_0048002477 /DNA_START=133 /DNA_END=1485 /DNA_ORIENTATION=+